MSATTGYIDGKQTASYRIWAGMKNRCLNPNNKDYARYGGRGICVCARWRESFENFLDDMGERPDGKSIDRWPNNDGNYEPGNCRWATAKEQRENMADVHVHIIEADLGVTRHAVRQRIRRGWPVEQAVSVGRSNRWSDRRRVT
jgi:hypothetical protein